LRRVDPVGSTHVLSFYSFDFLTRLDARIRRIASAKRRGHRQNLSTRLMVALMHLDLLVSELKEQ
jgi:hypothetical protein